jgi:GNAT superfamily N-acetyltransferase
VEIRPLQPTDDRTRFDCGDPDLDRFFRIYSGQNQFRHHVGTTYVAVEGAAVLGYLTVSAGDIELDGLPAATRRGLPRYPLPILRLARLAVDATAQKQGVGQELLRFVCGLALRMAEDYGCVGIVVDARPDAVSFYERYGFRTLEVLEGLSDARPQPTPMFLALRDLQAISGSR